MPQTPLVAFQGEPGAYSEAAAQEFFGPEVRTLPRRRFEDVFEAVVQGQADYGMIPIENSLAGSVHRNYDLLQRYPVHIVGEYPFRVRHYLMALPGVRLEQLRYVYSHPQALAQCDRNLQALGLEPVAAADTAGSARWLKESGRRDAGVIASRRAAEVYGLEILREGMEDNPANYTRFLVIATEPYQGDDAPHGFKTSIVFTLPHKPGSLFKALSVFALRDIDLTKIESRPLPGRPWEYLFYVDFLGHANQPPGERALSHLREIAPYLRVLGTYPRWPLEAPPPKAANE
ncbi:MAG: prephenate dehydratase [Chloroflexi bacterium]|nr:prephenate dehydratase [Chloroflexota bacterium]